MDKKTTICDNIVILQIKNWEEKDKLITAFSEQQGKIDILAYGVKQAKSAFAGLLRPMNNLQVELSPGKRYEMLRQCELIGSSVPMITDINQLAYISIIAEITIELTAYKETLPNIYVLLLDTLRLLQLKNKRLVTVFFGFKMLELTGFAPCYQSCVVCNKEIASDAFFSPLQGGAVCQDCSVSTELAFSFATNKLLAEIMLMDFKNPPELKIKGKDLKELENILYKFLTMQIEKPLRTLKFLQQI